MDLTPPEGSRISVDYTGGDPTIIVPARQSASRYFGGVFLLFWLGGWAFGFKSVASQLLSGQGNLFMVFWLGAWTVGGIFASLAAYRTFRPAVPEKLQLRSGGIAYDAGVPPLEFNAYGNRKNTREFWASLLSKRTRAEFNRPELQTLRLREVEAGNRLTIDLGAQRLDLGSQASEVEREWLAAYWPSTTDCLRCFPKRQPETTDLRCVRQDEGLAANAFAIARKSCHDRRL